MCIRQQPDQEQRPSQIAGMTNVRIQILVSRCVREQPGEKPNSILFHNTPISYSASISREKY